MITYQTMENLYITVSSQLAPSAAVWHNSWIILCGVEGFWNDKQLKQYLQHNDVTFFPPTKGLFSMPMLLLQNSWDPNIWKQTTGTFIVLGALLPVSNTRFLCWLPPWSNIWWQVSPRASQDLELLCQVHLRLSPVLHVDWICAEGTQWLSPCSWLFKGPFGRDTVIYCPESSVYRVNTAWLVEQETTCCFNHPTITRTHTHGSTDVLKKAHAETRDRPMGAECFPHYNHYGQWSWQPWTETQTDLDIRKSESKIKISLGQGL